jgi:hypothetical protein
LLKQAGLAATTQQVREFAFGFTQAKATFDFVDIGNDQPETKIRGKRVYSESTTGC